MLMNYTVGFNNGYNNIVNRNRRHSYSCGDEGKFLTKIHGIYNNHANLTKNKAMSDLTVIGGIGNQSGIISLDFKDTDVKNINSANYVYCGAATSMPTNNFGITTDSKGRLILIKGKSNDLCKGVFKKYTDGYKYETAQLINATEDKKFDKLYLADDGKLIGVEKGTFRSFIVNISIPECVNENQGQNIIIDYIEHNPLNQSHEMNFSIKENVTACFYLKDNKVYSKLTAKLEGTQFYSFILSEIKLDLKKSYKINSIKRAAGYLQIEVSSEAKKRVYYLNPLNILASNSHEKTISHKPMQDFSSRLGNDPYEKYHTGQPFVSDRKANFSSKNIPLFSSVVDNFRANIKKAKSFSQRGKGKEASMSATKAFDPFMNSARSAIAGLVKSSSPNNGLDDSKKIKTYNSVNDFLLKSNSVSKIIIA